MNFKMVSQRAAPREPLRRVSVTWDEQVGLEEETYRILPAGPPEVYPIA